MSHQDAAEGTDSAFTRPGEGAEGNARLVGVGVAATFTPTNHWSGQQAPGEQQHQHER